MNYTIPAKETVYKGLRFRSRLEAKWAAFFDLVGIRWQYEPFDLPGWTPDFVLHTNYLDEPMLCEIKPVFNFDTEVARKMAPYGDYVLLLGAHPCVDDQNGQMGWANFKSRFPEGAWALFPYELGINHDSAVIERCWAEAHNLTRFTYPNG